MKFFSKIVFICNLCFTASVILRFSEMAKKKKENFNGHILLNPLESTLVVLGYGAIFLSVFFAILCLFLFVTKRIHHIPGWMVIANLLFLLVQVYYFFFSNF